MLIDSHCHLDFPELSQNLPDVLNAMRQQGVAGAICVGVNQEDFPRVQGLVSEHPHLFASFGLHPEYSLPEEPDQARLETLASQPKVIAIGETGLDYHWQRDKPEWQRQRFRLHIRAAIALKKPLIIHMREATEDTLRILAEENAQKAGGIMHCFSGSWETAQKAMDLGFYISFSGIVTFKNAHKIKEVAEKIPLDRMLVETDAPFLAPAPFRGQLNQPAYVRYVAEEIARLRGAAFEDIAKATTGNFFSLFPQTRQALQP